MKGKKIVVIGGGLSGLFCGALLARKGHSVVILEQHITVGGLAAGFTRKGYYFDSGMARFVASNLRGYFEELGLYDAMEFRRHTAALCLGGRLYTPGDAKEYFDACMDAFPKQAEGLARFYTDHVREAAVFMDVNAATAPMSYTGAKQPVMMAKMMGRLLRRGAVGGMAKMTGGTKTSIEDLLAGYIDRDSDAFAMLTGTRSFDVFQKGGQCSLMTFIGAICSNFRLNQYPRHGFQAMCDRISRVVNDNGGTVITGAKATKVVVEHGKACAVEYLKGGKTHRIEGDTIISAGDLKKAYFHLLEERQSDPAVLDRLKASESTRPVLFLYLGLRLDPGVLRQRFAGCDEVYHYPAALGANRMLDAKDFYRVAPMVAHSSCLSNPEHAPQGCSNLQVYLPNPPEGWNWGIENGKKTDAYRQVKQKAVADILSSLEKLVPELADRGIIEVCELGTPHTVERYTGNSGGAHCGFSWDAAANGFNQGMGKFHSKHEKVQNLYFIGHWTGFMGGVTNAFWSARNLSRNLSRQL